MNGLALNRGTRGEGSEEKWKERKRGEEVTGRIWIKNAMRCWMK